MGRLTYEEVLIKRIEGVIRGIRLRTREPNQEDVSEYFKRLAEVNEGKYDELMVKYFTVVKSVSKKPNNV